MNPVMMNPAQAVEMQRQAMLASGVMEWAITGIGSILGAGALTGLVWTAWQGIKSMRHLGQGAAGMVAGWAGGKAVRAGAAAVTGGGSEAVGAAASAAKTAQGARESLKTESGSGSGRPGFNPATAGAHFQGAGMAGPLERDGAVGFQDLGDGKGKMSVPLMAVLRGGARSVDDVHVDAAKVNPSTFESVLDAARHEAHVTDANGRQTMYSRAADGFRAAGAAPDSPALSADQLRAQYYPAASSADASSAAGKGAGA